MPEEKTRVSAFEVLENHYRSQGMPQSRSDLMLALDLSGNDPNKASYVLRLPLFRIAAGAVQFSLGV